MHIYNRLKSKLEISHGGHQKNSAMEGMRGLAILLVFFAHYAEFGIIFTPANSTSYEVREFIFRMGQSGVDLFFILSGYLIYGTLIKNKDDILSYAKKRLIRIYPAFIAALLIYIGLFLIIKSRSKLPTNTADAIEYIALNIALLPILPFIGNIKPIINASWSLAYELLFYIASPLFISITCLRKINPIFRLLILGTGAVAILITLYVQHENKRFMMFAAGAMLFEMIKLGITPPRWVGAILLLVGAIFTGSVNISKSYPTFTLFFTYQIACLEAFSRTDGLSRILEWTPLRWLGNMSYSFYLIHGLSVQAFVALISNVRGEYIFWLAWIPAFAISALTGFILYNFVERPLSLSNKQKEKCD